MMDISLVEPSLGERHLAIIPARLGSQRLPRKNLCMLQGKPLVAWTIEAAMVADCFSRVLLSTESQEIAKIASHYQLEVPFMRPLSLATSTASSWDIVLHALDWFEQEQSQVFDTVCLLQPTSPLRTEKHIRQALSFWQQSPESDGLVSVTACNHNPLWTGKLSNKNTLEGFQHIEDYIAKQEREKRAMHEGANYFQLNGAIYWYKVSALKQKKRAFWSSRVLGYQISQAESADIDTSMDLAWADFLMSHQDRSQSRAEVDEIFEV